MLVCLPVSTTELRLRPPDGADELALAEGDPAPLASALRLLNRLARHADGAAADCAALPVTDFELLLLHLRQSLLGPAIASHVGCPSCRERVEISFPIRAYIAAIRPTAPPGLAAAPAPAGSGEAAGWMTLHGAIFRLPLVADLLAVQPARQPGEALRQRCLAPGTAPTTRRRIEQVIARMAPPASQPVGGACPACGAAVQALFDVAGYVVAELRRQAAGVYADVHALAGAYGWDEAAILALPGSRRRHYAELVRAGTTRQPLVA